MAEDSLWKDKYMITCPYCFGEAFSHEDVHFRADTYYVSEKEIEEKVGKEIEIEMMEDSYQRNIKLEEYQRSKRFLVCEDKKYEDFWKQYAGTTEKSKPNDKGPLPWRRPIISTNDGVMKFIRDADQFVIGAVDILGKETRSRVCPHCHNPLPIGFGKNRVKNISIIGITGAGKTVYISQLLKGMMDSVAKVGLAAFFTGNHVTDFIKENPVKRGKELPGSTVPEKLSQPMFYDIVQGDGNGKRTDTIVLYDIAGENCKDADSMIQFAKFVEHADGLILLIDPKQLKFVFSESIEDEEIEEPSKALITLHGVLCSKTREKNKIPTAICVSKSDQCFDILPEIAQDDVQIAGENEMGLPINQFDGKNYNKLSQELTELMKKNANAVCNILANNYINYNFFAVSAIGCECQMTEKGFVAPVFEPEPKRIEEPVLWLFKQFGFIESNTKVKRPFKIPQSDMKVWKSGFLGFGGKYEMIKRPPIEYEEDAIEESEEY